MYRLIWKGVFHNYKALIPLYDTKWKVNMSKIPLLQKHVTGIPETKLRIINELAPLLL